MYDVIGALVGIGGLTLWFAIAIHKELKGAKPGEGTHKRKGHKQ